MQDFAAMLEGKTIITKINLLQGFHHIPVNKDDIPKTAVITLFGLFEFLFMPFGLKPAPQTFQQYMDCVIRGLDFVFVYMDDLLIASSSLDKHARYIQLVFELIASHGLAI